MHVRNSETADTTQLWPPHCDTNSDKVMKIVAMIPRRKHNQIHSHIKIYFTAVARCWSSTLNSSSSLVVNKIMFNETTINEANSKLASSSNISASVM